jgi:SpoVK/Ycf46/Vps4 family AAA+-type ATPase
VSDPIPVFLEQVHAEYKSKIAHTFIMHGNINDFIDNSGHPQSPIEAINSFVDDAAGNKSRGPSHDRGLQNVGASAQIIKAVASFDIATGMTFANTVSHEHFVDIMTKHYGAKEIEDWRADWKYPVSIDAFFFTMGKWIQCSKAINASNREARESGKSSQLKNELMLWVLFPNSDALFPAGQISQLGADRYPIVALRNWAKDVKLGERTLLIMLSRHLTDIHESLRGASSGVVSISIAKPNLADRKEWISNYSKLIKTMVASRPEGYLKLGNSIVRQVEYADGFDEHQFAIQSAGMSRKQLQDVVMKAWKDGIPVDFQQVRERKQRAIDDEYEGLVDFFEPEFGFEELGGHTELKQYLTRKVIMPLRNGDARLCSSGVLLTGPPGTGKTQLAKALAKEAKMNFMIANLGKLFGGIVGETEQKTRKFFEAVESASPVIVFIDEIDSVLSSGRTSHGDSGVAARVFNSIMQFLSDDSRKGKVVVVAASNRPDLLDTALIRSGRFDAKIPALPPFKGDAVGRAAILAALGIKHKMTFSKELAKTLDNPTSGLGRLLKDAERTWTGAEIEVVLKEAFDNAVFSERKGKDGTAKYIIHLEDWNIAMDNIIPNTSEVERMSKLSLYYVDNLSTVSEAWRPMARDKAKLREDLGLDDR